jgi:phospholipase/lecithinase/hemolysin
MTYYCTVTIILLLCKNIAQGAVPAVYVFGDSLADVGNNNHLQLSLLKANFPHNGVDYPGRKATGRFSNGHNFADFLGMFVIPFNIYIYNMHAVNFIFLPNKTRYTE